jgi:hypothetical protein
LMAPGTPGQEAILPALTRTHMGRMQQRKCCVFSGDMSSRRAQSKPKSRTAADVYIRFDLYWLQKFGGGRRLLDANGIARRYLPAGNNHGHHGTFHKGELIASHRDGRL